MKKKIDIKVVEASKIKTKDDLTKELGITVIEQPYVEENTKWLNKVLKHHRGLIEKESKNREQRRKAGKAAKRPEAIFEFVKAIYEQKKHLSGQQIYRHIRKTYTETNPEIIDDLEVYWYDGRLYQRNDIKNQLRSISYKTFLNYLTEIKKTLK